MKNPLDSHMVNKEPTANLLGLKELIYFKISFLLYVILFFLVTLGIFNSKISYGLGFGDLFIWINQLASFIPVGIYICIVIALNKKYPILNFIAILYMIFTSAYFLLHLTIWRSSEMPWNGNIFIQ